MTNKYSEIWNWLFTVNHTVENFWDHAQFEAIGTRNLYGPHLRMNQYFILTSLPMYGKIAVFDQFWSTWGFPSITIGIGQDLSEWGSIFACLFILMFGKLPWFCPGVLNWICLSRLGGLKLLPCATQKRWLFDMCWHSVGCLGAWRWWLCNSLCWMWPVRRKSELLRMTHNKHPSRLANDNKLFKSSITKTTDNFHMIKCYAQTISHTDADMTKCAIYIYTLRYFVACRYAKSPWKSLVNLAYSFVGHSFHFPKWSTEDNPIFG
jgi:hypothetical protein